MTIPHVRHPLVKLKVPSTDTDIAIRPMFVLEEKILLMAKQSQQLGDILNSVSQVVNNCVVTKGFDLDKITIFDLEWLFLQVWAVSGENKIKVVYTDNEDKMEYPFEVDLLSVSVEIPANVQKKITLGENTYAYMRWPAASTYNDETILLMTPEEANDEMIFRHIDRIGIQEGSSEKFYPVTGVKDRSEIKDFIDHLPTAAFNEIKKFMDTSPTMKHVIKYTNSKGTEREIVMSSLSDFFSFV